jgi:hypothetical protein
MTLATLGVGIREGGSVLKVRRVLPILAILLAILVVVVLGRRGIQGVQPPASRPLPPSVSLINPIVAAIESGQTAKEVRALIDAGADVNKVAPDGNVPLFSAIGQGNGDIVEMLLNSGASVNYRSPTGMQPLHLAATTQSEMCEVLLKHGAPLNARENDHGWTPLFFAVTQGDARTVDLLLKSGADVCAKDKTGRTVREHNRYQIANVSERSAVSQDIQPLLSSARPCP